MKVWIGIDNGITGSVGIITEDGKVTYVKTPTKWELSYTKKVKHITRIEGTKLYDLFKPYVGQDVHLMLERPMVNPQYFVATLSAMRSLEATLIVIEICGFKFEYLPSTEWQDVLLPEMYEGVKVEKENLKPVSLAIGSKLFPQIDYKGFKDADGLLIAEYCRRKYQVYHDISCDCYDCRAKISTRAKD